MGRISSFFTGAAIGALAALVFAPKTGEQTRAFVAEKANAVMGEVKDFGSGMPGVAQDVLKTASDKGADFVNSAVGKAKEVASPASASAPVASDDELREKIEAARKRIAAQVAENAEASKAVEVAASAAEAVAESI